MNGTDEHNQDPLPPATSDSSARDPDERAQARLDDRAQARRGERARSRAELRMALGPRERPEPDLREPAHHVADRWAEEPAPRPVVGERVKVRPETVRRAEPKNPVRPGPNAPLLMRIVRSPYALQPGKHVRVPAREARVVGEPRETLGQPGRAWRELRAELSMPNPMRAYPHRPEPRPRPKVIVAEPRSTSASFLGVGGPLPLAGRGSVDEPAVGDRGPGSEA